MRKNPEFEELFDDDFEVTYEEYVPNEYRSSNDIYNDYDDDDDYYDDDYYDDDYEDEYYESDDENSDYDHTDPDDCTKKKKRRKNSKIPLAAPIRKGGRILSNISASLIRSLIGSFNFSCHDIRLLDISPCKCALRRYYGSC